MVAFGIEGVAGVVTELRNVVQEKEGGRGASSRGFVPRIDKKKMKKWAMQHRLYYVGGL